MKRAIPSILLTGVLGLLLSSCGGNNSTSKPQQTFKTRAFVTNSYNGGVYVIDYTKDAQAFSPLTASGTPGKMILTPDGASTLVISTLTNTFSVIDNKTEGVFSGPQLPALINDLVITPDSKKAYVTTRNAPVDGKTPGAVQIVTLSDGTLATQIEVPLAQKLALSPDGKKLLVFSDEGAAYYVDLTATTPSAVLLSGALSRPVSALFNSDGTKAYVVDCGPECGAPADTGAKIAVLDMTANPPAIVGQQAVDAATTIFADSSNNLYVAGTKPGSLAGSLTVLTPSANTVTISKGPFPIGPGTHTQMMLASNNKLFIAATNCSDTGAAGCLTIYDTSAAASTDATNPNPKILASTHGYVTGMASVPRRNVAYVITGGELLTYDTTKSAIFTGPCLSSCSIDIFGNAVDVKIIDQ